MSFEEAQGEVAHEATAYPPTFQDVIMNLQRYWADQGCVVLQPYDNEVGAGTFHTATTLRSLGPGTWRTAYVQPSRRPTDGRYGENPNRLQHYYQFQVILKPSPDNVQELYLNSLRAIGINVEEHDVRFVEDDWESPTLGAWGLGWEVWIDGMECTQFTYFQQVGGFECKPVPAEITYGLERLTMYIQGVDSVYDMIDGMECTQFTYFQQVGGFECKPVPAEITYGLERLTMYIQGVDSVYDIVWSRGDDGTVFTYGDVFLENEREFSAYNFEVADTDMLFGEFDRYEAECNRVLEAGLPLPAYEFSAYNFEVADTDMLFGEFDRYEAECNRVLEAGLPLPAYDYVLKCSHAFNLLDARGVISATERMGYILRVRTIAKACCASYLEHVVGEAPVADEKKEA